MDIEPFYLTCLAQGSYLIGSGGIAAVVDPQRDVDVYVDEASRRGLKIAHVIETHLHADFVSGHRELAERTGAAVYFGARAEATCPHVAVADGDEIAFGTCRLRFLETPGHTLESVSVVVTDLEAGGRPVAVFTGDTLFVGDVGRPDLAKGHTPEELAGLLYDSLHGKLLSLPDEVRVHPAHGAGSLCGKNMSSERASTIGHERRTNPALRPMAREAFVAMMTAELPLRPDYFLRDVELNRAGARPIAELEKPRPLAPAEVRSAAARGALVLDTRPAAAFGEAHIPGSIQIGLSGQYASWAGILIGLDAELVLVAEDPDRLGESQMRLARVGIERVIGHLDGGLAAWTAAGLPLATVKQVSVLDLQRLAISGEGQVLDVRGPAEFQAGHVDGATLFSLDRLASQPPPLDPIRPVTVHCKSGYRSSIATSLLRRAGFTDVSNVTGGFDAWVAAKLPIAVGL